MKASGIFTVLLTVSLMVSIVGGESDLSGCEKAEKLEQEAEQKISAAETDKEMQEIEQKYSSQIEKAREKCRVKQSNLSETEENISEILAERTGKPEEILGAEKCRERASGIKKNFIERFSETSFTKTDSLIASFRKKRERLISRCKNFKKGEIPERTGRISEEPPTFERKDEEEKRVELDYSLPEKMPEECRSNIKKMQKEYRKEIRNSREKERKLRQEFYSKIEQKVEECGSVPRIANVSNAPESMAQSCRERVRKLNKKIISEADASVGSRVPKDFREEYRNAMKNCVAGAAKKSITSQIKQKVLGGGKQKMQKKLEKKNSRIEKLEEKVERLRDRLESEEESQSSEITNREQQDKESSETGDQKQDRTKSSASTSQSGTDKTEPQREEKRTKNPERKKGKDQENGLLKSITGVFS